MMKIVKFTGATWDRASKSVWCKGNQAYHTECYILDTFTTKMRVSIPSHRE